MRLLGLCILALSACAGCGTSHNSSSASDPQVLENLKSQAADCMNAMGRHDYEQFANLSHPVVIEQYGGRAKFLEKVKSFPDALKSKGLDKWENKLGEPGGIYEGGTNLFAAVPYTLEFGGGGRRGTGAAFLIAVSSDRGATWKFIDGGGSYGDRAKLQSIFPGFPSKLQLPPTTPPSLNG